MKRSVTQPPALGAVYGGQRIAPATKTDMVEVAFQLAQSAAAKATDALMRIEVPVAADNAAKVTFSRTPTVEEVDRLMTYLMYVKDMAPVTRGEVMNARELAEAVADAIRGKGGKT